MMYQTGLLFLLVGSFLQSILAECPNACSAHGKCGAYDMCSCYRNWVANDCSERMCQFGLAHVDSPKGDLDSSGGALTGPDSKVVMNDQFYPYGTTEQYPATMDTLNNVVSNSAHEYRECSNKGTCDRTTGNCVCFDGYEGSACQRASCPSNANGMCSGHGTCQTIQEIATSDFNNIYELWDKEATMGCVCDPGYEGPDCSQRMCKYGVDPLYMDNNATIRYSNWTYFIFTQTSTATVYGNYSLVYTDAHGMKWKTDPIDIAATCATVASALEGLPNNVIPVNSVRCYQFPLTAGTYSQVAGVDPVVDSSVYIKAKYTVAFPENAGRLPQLSLETHLDGSRPTLYSDEVAANSIDYKVFANGFHGEDVDLINDRCFGVTVNVNTDSSNTYSYLSGLTTKEAELLKICLGDSDNDETNNIEVYNWDYGTASNPHLIKLQDATQYDPSLLVDSDGNSNWDPTLRDMPLSHICAQSDINDNLFGVNRCSNKNPPGFYALLYYTGTEFRLYHKVSNDYSATTEFYVYTTKGYLNKINSNAVVFNNRADYNQDRRVDNLYSNVLNVDTLSASSTYWGDMSCETTPIGTNGATDCFEKGDWAMFFNSGLTAAAFSDNPVYPNLYRIAKIWTKEKMQPSGTDLVDPKLHISRQEIILDYNMNARFTNDRSTYANVASAYKFHPATNRVDGGYRYFKSCAGRGICNADTGTCDCFGGYQGDDCTCQWAMAV
jgi:hypothetical protein